MVTGRREYYCETLSRMIRKETVSHYEETDLSKFEEFRDMLEELFPKLFEVCEKHRFQNGTALLWKGDDPGREPVLFMNHHDVVEATGEWKYAPFSGICAEGKLWGRGTLDDKGGLWAMLQAGEELAEEGFSPSGDIWFISTSTEETTGEGAAEIAENALSLVVYHTNSATERMVIFSRRKIFCWFPEYGNSERRGLSLLKSKDG